VPRVAYFLPKLKARGHYTRERHIGHFLEMAEENDDTKVAPWRILLTRSHDRVNLVRLIAIINKDPTMFMTARSANHTSIINQIKNNCDLLEWYLNITSDVGYGDPGDIFTGVNHHETYDLFKIYGLSPNGLREDDVPAHVWNYLKVAIRYTPDTYCLDCVRECKINMDARSMCAKCKATIVETPVGTEETTSENPVPAEQNVVLTKQNADTVETKQRVPPDDISNHQEIHGHPFEPMELKFTQDENGDWYGNNVPIRLHCPGCDVTVIELKPCEKCKPILSDDAPLVKIVRLDRTIDDSAIHFHEHADARDGIALIPSDATS